MAHELDVDVPTALGVSAAADEAIRRQLQLNWDGLLGDAASKYVGAQLASAIAPVVADAIAQIQRNYLRDALAKIDLPAYREAVGAAAQQIAERAAMIEAGESSSYRSLVYKVADDHHGLVTTAMAKQAGVPPVEVRKLAARGGLSHLARGLYRVDGIDGGDRAPFAEAVLRVGDGALLVGESVLAFHDLGLVNPRRIAVGTSRRVRRDLPDHIRVVRTDPDPSDVTEYDGVRSLTVERALRDSIGSIMPERLIGAVEHAADEGLIRRQVRATLVDEIEAAA
jgi:hypothetical protein